MPTPTERAAKLWLELSSLIPFSDGDYDYRALSDACIARIVQALAPPIDKSVAWRDLLKALPTTEDSVPVLEALYAYREALLRWQREVIDGQAREAELAIARLRSYTRKEPT